MSYSSINADIVPTVKLSLVYPVVGLVDCSSMVLFGIGIRHDQPEAGAPVCE